MAPVNPKTFDSHQLYMLLLKFCHIVVSLDLKTPPLNDKNKKQKAYFFLNMSPILSCSKPSTNAYPNVWENEGSSNLLRPQDLIPPATVATTFLDFPLALIQCQLIWNGRTAPLQMRQIWLVSWTAPRSWSYCRNPHQWLLMVLSTCQVLSHKQQKACFPALHARVHTKYTNIKKKKKHRMTLNSIDLANLPKQIFKHTDWSKFERLMYILNLVVHEWNLQASDLTSNPWNIKLKRY